MAVKVNYYEILGVSREATLDEIKKAHRKQALKYHPDRNPDDKEAEEMMKKVNATFEELSDEDKRRKYDSEQHSYNQENWYYQSYQVIQIQLLIILWRLII